MSLTAAEREIERRWVRRSPKPIKLPGKRRHGTTSGYVSGCGPSSPAPPETWRQELRRLGWVVNHLRRLSPASIHYLRDLLNDPRHFNV